MVSVIIPTYNGAHKVVNLLRSLEDQTFKNFEVIVVVDGSIDQTEKVVSVLKFSFPLQVIYQENKGRAGARNSGYNNAKGKVILFFDDDVRPTINCIKLHWEHHQHHENSMIVGGIEEDYKLAKTDIQKYKISLTHKWTKEIAPKGKTLIKQKLYLSAANLSMPSALFQLLGKFDERLSDTEDFDLAVRSRINNINVYIDPENLVWHDDFITLKSYIRRNVEYRNSFLKLLKIHPEYCKWYDIKPFVKNYKLKKAFYFWFSFSFWIYIVDSYNFLIYLPRKMRYKIYDFIITSHYLYFPDKIRHLTK